MRKSLWIMLAVMVVAVCAPNAHADTFTYDFTSTTAAEAGDTGSAEFTESSILTSATTITSFTSDTFSNLVSLLIAPESGENCSPFGAPGPCIAVSTGDGVTSFYYFSSNLTSTGTYDTKSNGFSGTLKISEVSTTAPEPSSVALMLLGVGLVFVLRKRGHQLAT